MTFPSTLFAALLLAVPQGTMRDGGVTEPCRDHRVDERAMLADAEDGRFDEISLLRAALVAGGNPDAAEARRLAARFDQWSGGIEIDAAESESNRAAAVFAKLHDELLTGQYRASCSDVAATLRTGDYNCVTATLLYMCALRNEGISARAYATRGHVFCRVGAGDFLVQTTCRRWFELVRRDSVSAGHGPSLTPQPKSRDARRLSDVALVAKIYYNRGVACFRREDFADGLLLTRRSLRLDPRDKVARGNELAGLNNWSLALCRRREFAKATELLDELRRLDPHYPTLSENRAYLYRSSRRQPAPQSDQRGGAIDTTDAPRG